MSASYGALCTDFFINQKLSLKMDLPTERETVLGLFDRIRRERPIMNTLRRYEGELSLESPEEERMHEWLELRRTTIRSGSVNPDSLDNAFRLHRLVLQVSPYFLTISPLDIEFLEVVFGFDLEAESNRNNVVHEALLSHDSPLANIADPHHEPLLDFQPFLSFALDESCETRAMIDVKTRVRAGEIASGEFNAAPITIYCTVRREAPINSIDELPGHFNRIAELAQRLVDDRVIPRLVTPIRDVIISRPS